MNKQTTVLIGVFLVLATLYVAKFTDLLKHKNIQIHWTNSRAIPGSISFFLDKGYELTSVKVVPTEEAKTNKYPHELWHLIPNTSPVVLSNFTYGVAIPGMKPKISTALPERLEPGMDYSLLVETSTGLKGEKSFSVP
jgi:hypothetical protein